MDTLSTYADALITKVLYSASFWLAIKFLSSFLLIVLLQVWLRSRSAVSRPENLDHDRFIFKNASSLYGEQGLLNFLKRLECDDSYSADTLVNVRRLCRFLEAHENRYLTKALNSVTQSFLSQMRLLDKFLAEHCAAYPAFQPVHDVQMCLQPECNPACTAGVLPDEIVRYCRARRRLSRIVQAAWQCYQEYRRAGRIALHL